MAVDVTRQPRVEQAAVVDLTSPVILGFLRTRLPLVMAREKRRWEAVSPEKRSAILELYADSVGRGKDLARQAMIAGDTSLRSLSAANTAAMGVQSAGISARGSVATAATTQAGMDRRQQQEQAFKLSVSGMAPAEESKAVNSALGITTNLMNGGGLPFDQRIPNGFNDAYTRLSGVLAGVPSDMHKGALTYNAINQLRSTVQSADRTRGPGFENLTPEEQAIFNDQVVRLYGRLAIPLTATQDGEVVPVATARQAWADVQANTPLQTQVYGVGMGSTPQTGRVVGGSAPQVQASSEDAFDGGEPATGGPAPFMPGQPNAMGDVVVTEEQAASLMPGDQVTGSDGIPYVQLQDGSLIPSPEYGYSGNIPAMQQQLARDRALQGLLKEELDALKSERDAAMASGDFTRTAVDLFDSRPNRSQDDVQRFADRMASANPDDRAEVAARLTELKRQLTSRKAEQQGLRAEEGAASGIDKANVEMTGEPGTLRFGAGGTRTEQVNALADNPGAVSSKADELNALRARLEVSVQRNKLTGEAAKAAMAPYWQAVHAAANGMDDVQRDALVQSLTGPDAVRAAAKTMLTAQAKREAELRAFSEEADLAAAAPKLDENMRKALDESYSPREADRPAPGPSGPDKRDSADAFDAEPPALPTKSLSPVDKESLFDPEMPGTAAPKAVPVVTPERGASAEVVQGPYTPLPRDAVFTPGRDLGMQVYYQGMKPLYQHVTGKDPDDEENAEEYATWVADRLKKRKSAAKEQQQPSKEDAFDAKP